MKKYKKLLFGTVALSLALASCTEKNPDSTVSSVSTSGQENISETDKTSGTGQSGNNGEKKNELDFHGITLNDIYLSQGTSRAPTTGTYKVLVLPIEFSGKNEAFRADYKERIKNAFEGSSDKNSPDYTGYSESLKSFYQKSSYGKLNLDFVYADKYQVGMTSKNWYNSPDAQAKNGEEQDYDYGSHLLKKAYDNYTKNNTIDKDCDSDKDGYIDATIMVYSTKDYSIDSKNKKFDKVGYYWAYCYNATAFDSNTWAFVPDQNTPIPDNYMFLSYDMLWDNNDNSNNGQPKSDYHTVVHEYGHMLGLDDYYGETDEDFGSYNPMGGVVMQDYNICDHDAFSKTQFGWTEVNYVTTSTTITIKALNTSGQTIIIPTNNGNGTLWDEYIQIELYNPTGLNELDSKTAYGDTLGLSKAGIKVYHIDNRLYYFDGEDDSKYGYVDLKKDVFDIDDNYYLVAASNCQKLGSEYVPDEYNLCQMIQAEGYDTFRAGTATNDDLFQTGSVFDPLKFTDYFQNGKGNNGADFNFTVEFVKVSAEEATVKITFR
jgi:M6 family metalloprotease-like protein